MQKFSLKSPEIYDLCVHDLTYSNDGSREKRDREETRMKEKLFSWLPFYYIVSTMHGILGEHYIAATGRLVARDLSYFTSFLASRFRFFFCVSSNVNFTRIFLFNLS